MGKSHSKKLFVFSLFVFGCGAWTESSKAQDKITLSASDVSPAAQYAVAQFSKNGQVSTALVEAYLSNVKARRQQIYKLVLAEEGSNKKADKDKVIVTFDLMISMLDQLKVSKNKSEQELLATRVLALDFALKAEGQPRAVVSMARTVVNVRNAWTVPKKLGQISESSNLVNPKTGRVLSSAEALALAKSGVDISKFNGRFHAAIWKNPSTKISKLNLADHYFKGGTALYNGKSLDVGNGARWELDSPRFSQTSPKMNINFFRDGKKVSKVKLKYGREYQSDPTVNSLMAAIGYSTDINKFIKNQKIYLGKINFDEFLKEFTQYYNKDKVIHRYDIHDYLEHKMVNGVKTEVFEDEGGKYIVFKEGEIEADDDDQLRIGEWSLSELAHGDLREVRGLMIFNLWVSNSDLFESRNNKLVLKESEKGFDWHFIQHDSGLSMGHIISEQPNGFREDLVSKNSSSEIAFTYRSFKNPSISNKITFADGRWATRLIAQLTREQISSAVQLGGWHPSVAQLYVEKLIRRRNQLVQAFSLESEMGLIPENTKTLTTADQVVVDGKVVKAGESTDSVRNFNQYRKELMDPVAVVIERAIQKGLQVGTGGNLSRIELTSLESDNPLFASAIVDANRQIETNPHPKSENDRYLVSDVVKVGLRLGLGDIVGGDVSTQVTYTLSYPAKSYDAALNGDQGVLNFDLPFDVIKDKLPRDSSGRYNFVLSREVDLEGRGWIRTDGAGSNAPIGTELSVGRVKLTRTIIDARSIFSSILVHEDRSHYNKLSYRAYFRLLNVLKLNFIDGDLRQGRLEGRTFDLKTLNDPKVQSALSDVIKHGNFAKLVAYKKPLEEISAAFRSSRSRLSIPFISSLEVRKSRTDIKVTDAEGDTLQDLYQINYSKKSRWMFIDNGEEALVKINVQSPKSGLNGKNGNWSAEISYAMLDKDTRSKELQGYIDFMNSVARSTSPETMIDFTPSLHSRNDKWETQDILVNLGFCRQGIENILQMSEEAFDKALAQVLGISVATLKKEASDYTRSNVHSPRGGTFPVSKLGRQIRGTLYARSTVIYELKKIAKAQRKIKELDPRDAKKTLSERSELVEKQTAALVKMLRQSAARSSGMYKADIIQALNLIAGKNNVEVAAQISPAQGDETLIPGKDDRVLYARSGGECLDASEAIVLFPMDSLEQYHSLNWVREIETEISNKEKRKPSSISTFEIRFSGQKLNPYYMNLPTY